MSSAQTVVVVVVVVVVPHWIDDDARMCRRQFWTTSTTEPNAGQKFTDVVLDFPRTKFWGQRYHNVMLKLVQTSLITSFHGSVIIIGASVSVSYIPSLKIVSLLLNLFC